MNKQEILERISDGGHDALDLYSLAELLAEIIDKQSNQPQ